MVKFFKYLFSILFVVVISMINVVPTFAQETYDTDTISFETEENQDSINSRNNEIEEEMISIDSFLIIETEDFTTRDFILSLLNQDNFSNFSIDIKDENGNVINIKSCFEEENKVLFSYKFEKGIYNVDKIHYELNNQSYVFDFTKTQFNNKFEVKDDLDYGINALNEEIDDDEKQISYQTHVQTYGWQETKYDGETSGTTGQSKRLEGITIKLTGTQYSGDILYRTHVQTYGWQDWKSNGQVSGTTGESKRLEAIQIKLSGDISNYYDVYYRVHAQNFGWLGWAKNGESAGTAGYAYRLEAIEIQLVPKGQTAPGSTENCFYEKNIPVEPEQQPELPETTLHPIMGNSEVTVNQMVSYFKSKNPNYDTFSKYGTTYDGILASGGAATIESFCQMYYEEALMEGIKPEIAFAQAMLETGFLQYGGDVKPDQYNFAGMGATGNGVAGNSFENVRMGIRAHVQHLKCYASTESLNNDRVDPRWSDSLRGKAIYVEYLSIPNNPYGTGWAGDPNYAEKIINMVNQMRTK